jgi:HAMP domain-containing protein
MMAIALAFATRRIAGAVTDAIGQCANELTRIAEGDLNVRISNADAATKVGDLPHSMVVLRDYAVAARESREKTRLNDEAAREADRRREKEAREAEARRQKEIGDERASVFRHLSSSIGTVGAAAAGRDFSPRIERHFNDPLLADMAASVNRMIDKVSESMAATDVML